MTAPTLPGQLSRTRCFTAGVPGAFTVAPDGTTVLFLRSRAGDDLVDRLWALDVGSGEERLLADPSRMAAAGLPPEGGGSDSPSSGAPSAPSPSGQLPAPAGGITAYATDAAVRSAVFAWDGGLWAVDVPEGRVRTLPAAGPVSDPRPDPAGRRIAYVSGGALRVIEADGTGDRVVAAPDGPDIAFGTGVHTDTTARPNEGSRGFWWAPDGCRLLVARVDRGRVGRWYLGDPADPAAEPRVVRHAAAGTPQAEVTLWIAGLGGGPRTRARWDRDAVAYVPGAGWDEHGPYAVVQSRDQRTVRVLGIDPADGRTRVLDTQHDPHWVQLVPGLPARTASGVLLAHRDLPSEPYGTRHLTADGVPVTPPGLQLRAVLHVQGEDVLFTASEEPTETHLWSCRPGPGGHLRRLTAGPAVHTGARGGGTLVRVARGSGGRTDVLRAGQPPVPLGSFAQRPVLEERVTRLVLGPRGLRAALHLPSWHRPGEGRLPVLLDPYGGAARQRVTAERDRRTLVSQWFAEQGFAVLVADGRGTPGRGPGWERAVHGDLFGPALDDQVAALHEAAALHPDLDLGRVGIRGWSFSGSLAALAVLRRPDVFHAAVAGAGVTDQRLHDAHWRERFLGHPDEHPERYDAASLLRAAPALTRPLLLVHGLADTVVQPANTLRLSRALLAAGRPHEVLLLPGAPHQPLGSPLTEPLLHHQAAFLHRHLSPTANS